MGKHSLPESPGFWRAVIIAGLRYLVVLLLIVAVGYGVYRLAFDRDDPEASAGETLTPIPSDPFLDPTPGSTTPPPEPSPSPTAPAQVTGQVQVLDGSGSTARRDAAERELEAAGYDVVAVGETSAPYDRTTIFYQPDNQQMAEAVASLLGATVVESAEGRSLNPDIPVAVVIGPDYAG